MTTLRPLATADIPAHAQLLAASEAVDRTAEHLGALDLAEEYANPEVELGRDIVGAFDGDDLVGYFALHPRPAPTTALTVQVTGTVRPDHRGRGVGTQLVTAVAARTAEIHADRRPDLPERVVFVGLSANTAQADLFAAIGLAPRRWNVTMRAQLAGLDLDGPRSFPAGLELVTHSPGLDPALLAAHNEVFLDHPDSSPWSQSMWEQYVTGSRHFRPDLTLLLVAGERVVAYVQTAEYDAYQAATGRREAFVAKVGTRREFRGRGVATSLLREALRRYRAAGYDESALDVDSENPTGALGVYERVGFEVEHRWTKYLLVRPPLTPGG